MGELWRREGGYREVLKVAGPLILSMGSWSILEFIDRMFLTWYDWDTLAAALPAGVLNFTFASFFIGTASYVNTFVAQYDGAGRKQRVGAAMWQGIYFSLGSGILLLGLIPLAPWIFDLVGHDPAIRPLEVIYFQIFCLMGFPGILKAAVSSFFTGRGDTWTVLWVNVVAVCLNVVLDYAWIFGHWGFPEWGIKGAAWATVVSHFLGAFLFLLLMFRRRFRETYHTLKGWRYDGALFRRLMRFGAPNGVHFVLEISGFTLFILLVGRLGKVPLAATNLAFNINTLAFLPMLGTGIAVSTLVGQYLGKDRPDLAERSSWSSLHLSVVYMLIMSAGFVGVPNLFLNPFAAHADPATFEPIREITILLLRFVAVYSVFDAIYIVFSAAVKGAGDTRFVMWVSSVASFTLMVIPTYLAVVVYQTNIYVSWIFVTVYIVTMAIVFLFRFRGGKWRSMRVIEMEEVSDYPVRG
ncbi:MAG: MATE family efflux transporter [bacterium]|nr:MATE family efflux transporter [bacterium]